MLVSAAVHAAISMYGINTDNSGIQVIDSSTSVATSVYTGAPFALPDSSAAITQCASGNIYFVSGGTNGTFYRFNPATPNIAPVAVGTTGAGVLRIIRLACTPGTEAVYGMGTSPATLYSFNVSTGAATGTALTPPATTPPVSGSGDVGFDAGGTLYFVGETTIGDAGTVRLWVINISTNTISNVGAITGLPDVVNGIAYDATGNLRLSLTDRTRLYGVSPLGGAATPIGATGSMLPVSDLAGKDIPGPDLAITKTDGRTFIPAGSTQTYTIVATNNGGYAVTGTLTDTVPASITGVTWTCTAPAGSSCTAAAGSGNAINTSATLAAGGQATYTITGTVSSTASGVLSNTANFAPPSFLTDSNPANNSVTDTTTITRNPVIDKSFSASPIAVNGVSALTLTITNPNPDQVLTGVAVSDTYPAGLVNTGTPSPTTTCSGATITGGVANGNSIGITGGSIPVSGSCTITVDVTSASNASYPNTIGAVTSTNGGTGNTASATLVVHAPPTVAKSFNPNPVNSNTSALLTITLTNPNTTAMTAAAFTDTYPAGLINSTPSGAATTCGGSATAAAGGGSVALSGGTIPASGSCTVTVNVRSATVGSYNNTIPAGGITTTNGVNSTAAASATLSVLNISPPTVAKSFSPATIQDNGASTLTLVISNPNAVATLTSVAVSDTYPANLDNFTTPNPTLSCTSGSTGARTGGVANQDTIGFSGGTILPGGSCAVTVEVTSGNTGTYNNTTGTVTSSNSAAGGTALATLTVQNGRAPPVISKTFTTTQIPVSGVSTLTFTIRNPNGQTLNNVAFTDVYPLGLVNATPPNVSSNCDNVAGGAAGTTGGAAGGNTIGLDGTPGAGGSPNDMPANSTCTVSVQVTSATPGTYNNVSGNVTASTGNNGSAPMVPGGNTASATLTVLNRPTISKNFAPDPINVNGVSVLTITLTNPNAGAAITGAAFTDTYPVAIKNGPSPGASTTCGGTVTAAANGPSVALIGGTIPAGGSCTVSVNVISSTMGAHVNNIPAGGLTTSNASANAVAASDTLTVILPLTIVKSSTAFSDPFNGTTNPKRIPGGFVNYALVVSNPGAVPIDLNSVVITDALPANTNLFVGDFGSVGSGPVAFTNGAPSSGLTYIRATDLSFSNDGGASYTYTPTANANGVDPAVTHVRINPKGVFNAGSNFTLTFRIRIE
ncbi:MAG: DUF11 domain-containing protein [Burkholderiales bacterium]|nr:DUF11 domain-containing protein [Burkholderiales bacterium]